MSQTKLNINETTIRLQDTVTYVALLNRGPLSILIAV